MQAGHRANDAWRLGWKASGSAGGSKPAYPASAPSPLATDAVGMAAVAVHNAERAITRTGTQASENNVDMFCFPARLEKERDGYVVSFPGTGRPALLSRRRRPAAWYAIACQRPGSGSRPVLENYHRIAKGAAIRLSGCRCGLREFLPASFLSGGKGLDEANKLNHRPITAPESAGFILGCREVSDQYCNPALATAADQLGIHARLPRSPVRMQVEALDDSMA